VREAGPSPARVGDDERGIDAAIAEVWAGGLCDARPGGGHLAAVPHRGEQHADAHVGTLELRATFRDTINEESCPPGVPVPAQVECFRFDGDGVVPGLGKATLAWHLIDDLTDGLSCEHFNFTTIVVKVAGKGEIDASLTDPKRHCWTRPPLVAGPLGARSPAAREATQEHRAISRSRRT
jgi:hypothetical protein